jgi:hypothetical protein
MRSTTLRTSASTHGDSDVHKMKIMNEWITR